MKITTEQAVEIIESDNFNVTDDRASDTVYIYDDGEGDSLYYESDELISADEFAECTWELIKKSDGDVMLEASINGDIIWHGWVWVQPANPSEVLKRITPAKA